jgi:hypothetical protein
MATATPVSSPYSFSLAGSPNSPLASELAGIAKVVPFTSTEPAGDALIIDGASASVDVATMQRVLDGGSLVAVANPTAALFASIRKLAGAAPGGTPAMVALKKKAKGMGYDFTCVQTPKTSVGANLVAALQTDLIPPPAPRWNPMNAATLAKALGSPAELVGDATLNFGIPQAAYGGCISAFHPQSWTSDSLTCDKVGGGKTQTLNNSYYVDLYVYWVNGYPNTPSYYIVINRLYGSISAGTPVSPAGDTYSEGYCNIYAQIQPNSITDDSGNPLPGCSLLDHSPQNSAPGSATTATSQTLELYGTSSSGPAAIPVTISMNDSVSYPGWGVADLSSGLTTSWQVYQSDGFNFNTHPLDTCNKWFYSLYDSSDNVLAFPSMSFGSVPFDTVTVWKITDSSFNNSGQQSAPAPFSVGFYGEVDHAAAQIHTRKGCNTNNHHQWYFVDSNPYAWNLDLNYVANLQNLAM